MDEVNLKSLKLRRLAFGLGLSLWLVFGLSFMFPQSWWGLNFLAFLDQWFAISAFAISAFLISLPLFKKTKFDAIENISGRWTIPSIGLATVIMGLIFWNFPILDDMFGDARNFRAMLDVQHQDLPDEVWQNLFSIRFSAEEGRRVMGALFALLNWALGMNYGEVIRLVDLLCGMLFVLVWLLMVRHHIRGRAAQIALGLAGMFSPFLLGYFGHMENYSLVYLLELIWLGLLLYQMKTGKAWLLWLLLPFLLVLVKAHPAMPLLLPALALAFVRQYLRERAISRKLFSVSGIIIGFVIPIFTAFLYLYFFVYQDHVDDRALNGAGSEAGNHVFLPLFSPNAPLDRYNMFSLNHFGDYFQMLLFLSPVALFMLSFFLAGFRKSLDLGKAHLITLGFTVLLFVFFFFGINPLYSMPMEWDLYSLTAPVFLVYVLALASELDTRKIGKYILPATLALSLLGSSAFWVHSQRKGLSFRMETIGLHIFKTYYLHSSNTLLFGLNLMPNDPELYMARKEKIITELRPFAQEGKDRNFAELLFDDGLAWLKFKNDAQTAEERFLEAEKFYPRWPENNFLLMERAFFRADFKLALQWAEVLVDAGYPDKLQALRIGVHCALAAEEYEKARIYAVQYLQLNPQDRIMREVQLRLENGERVEELIGLFEG